MDDLYKNREGCVDEVTKIWQEVLNRQDFGPDDNFFDAGGNSVLLMELFLKINKKYADVLTIPDIFACSTIRKLADFVDSKRCREEE